MLDRVLEPEVMDTERDALEYQAIDNTVVNLEFAERALGLCPPEGHVLDVGAGPGDIAVIMARRAPQLRITAIDLADHMLVLAQRNVERAMLENRITVRRIDAKATGYPDATFDAVVSNSLVHHIPEPLSFFREVARVGRPSAGIFIKDLLRPRSRADLDALVEHHAVGQTDYQRRLFSDSLHAALRIDEVRALCDQAGLVGVEVRQCSDRHWAIERAAPSQKGPR